MTAAAVIWTDAVGREGFEPPTPCASSSPDPVAEVTQGHEMPGIAGVLAVRPSPHVTLRHPKSRTVCPLLAHWTVTSPLGPTLGGGAAELAAQH